MPVSIACDVPSVPESGVRCKASHKVENILVAFFSVWQLGLVVMQEAEQRQLMPYLLPFLSRSAEVLAGDCRIRFTVLLCHDNLGLTTHNLRTLFCGRIPSLPVGGACFRYTVLGPMDKTVFAILGGSFFN